jgi:hypothetical protein
MNPLLVILNPRQIPQCLDAFAALDIRKAFVTGYTERGLVDVLPDVFQRDDFTHFVMISDDGVVRQDALDAVLRIAEHAPVATGWCNLDAIEANVNLTRSPAPDGPPLISSYDLYHFSEVLGYPTPEVPTYFTGMCLTAMSRDMWLKYPFEVFPEGNASDLRLSQRLVADDVPILAAREGFIYHVKETWNQSDTAAEKQLLIGHNQGVWFA